MTNERRAKKVIPNKATEEESSLYYPVSLFIALVDGARPLNTRGGTSGTEKEKGLKQANAPPGAGGSEQGRKLPGLLGQDGPG